VDSAGQPRGGGLAALEETKFFKLWQEVKKAGRDPHQAFRDRGWEP
jgi:hypothetical protein